MMKKTLALSTILLSLFSFTSVFAQTPEPTSQTGIVVATVNISNAKIVSQDNRDFVLSFDISNEIGVQPQVKYAVELINISPTNVGMADEHIYDEVLSIGENTTINKVIKYTVPASIIAGSYRIFIQSRNESGLMFANTLLGEVKITGGTPYTIEIIPGSCVLSNLGPSTTTRYMSPGSSITIDATSKLVAQCNITSSFPSDVILIPNFVTRSESTFGNIASTTGGSNENITIKNGTNIIAVELPKTFKPQHYYTAFSLVSADGLKQSNTATFDYTLFGKSGSIGNVIFNKTSYDAGDIANLQVLLISGVSQATVTVLILNGVGEPCSNPLSKPAEDFSTLQIPIIQKCTNPKANIVLSTKGDNGENIILDAKDYEVATPKSSPLGLKAIVIIMAVLIFIILLYLIYKRRHSAIKIMIFVLLGVSMTFGFTGKVFANTTIFSLKALYCPYLVNGSSSLIPAGCTCATTAYASTTSQWSVTIDKTSYIPTDTVYATVAWFSANPYSYTQYGGVYNNCTMISAYYAQAIASIDQTNYRNVGVAERHANNGYGPIIVPATVDANNEITSDHRTTFFNSTFLFNIGYPGATIFSYPLPVVGPGTTNHNLNIKLKWYNDSYSGSIGEIGHTGTYTGTSYTSIPQPYQFTNGSMPFTVVAPAAPPPPPPANCTAPWGSAVTHNSSVTAYFAATITGRETCLSQSRLCTNGTLSGSYNYPTCGAAPSCTTTQPPCTTTYPPCTRSGCPAPVTTCPAPVTTCPTPPPTCTFSYSAWSPSVCPSTGIQTRSATAIPSGCNYVSGPTQPLSQTCTPLCTGYNYSAWSPLVCPVSGTQTRTVLSTIPAVCSGGATPLLSQGCTYVAPGTLPAGSFPAPASSVVTPRCSVSGYVCDPDSYATPLVVDLLDNLTPVDSTTANLPSTSCGGYTNRGYTLIVPSSYWNGTTHSMIVLAHGVDNSGAQASPNLSRVVSVLCPIVPVSPPPPPPPAGNTNATSTCIASQASQTGPSGLIYINKPMTWTATFPNPQPAPPLSTEWNGTDIAPNSTFISGSAATMTYHTIGRKFIYATTTNSAGYTATCSTSTILYAVPGTTGEL